MSTKEMEMAIEVKSVGVIKEEVEEEEDNLVEDMVKAIIIALIAGRKTT
jgi:hypothetical protein